MVLPYRITRSSQKSPHLVRAYNVFFLKTVSVTVVGTRTSHFRDVVAKAKRCIFLHIIYEKLILGPYEEVHISNFFKKPFGLQGEVPEWADLER